MNTYTVLAPYTWTDYIDLFIGGPTFYEMDWVVVEAPNKRKAKGRAVKALRSINSPAYEPSNNPFVGLKVLSADTESVENAKEAKRYFPFLEASA